MYLGFDWHQKIRPVLTGWKTTEVGGLECACMLPVDIAVVGKIGLCIVDVFGLPRERNMQQILTGVRIRINSFWMTVWQSVRTVTDDRCPFELVWYAAIT